VKALMLSIDDIDDDFDKEDKMNNAEVKVIVTIEFRRRRPAMLLLRVGSSAFYLLHKWVGQLIVGVARK
jgi:hypothetical protein